MTFMMQQQVQRKSEKCKNNLNKINNSKLDIGQYDDLWRKLELGFAKSYKSGWIFGKWELR